MPLALHCDQACTSSSRHCNAAANVSSRGYSTRCLPQIKLDYDEKRSREFQARLAARLPRFAAVQRAALVGFPAQIHANLHHLARLRRLEHLVLDSSSRSLRGDGLEALTRLRSLTIAGAGANAESLLPRVACLTRLTALELQSCREFRGVGFEHLRALTSLAALKLQFCENFTTAGLHSVGALTQLQELYVSGWRRLAASSVTVPPFNIAALQGLTALQRLSLCNMDLQRLPPDFRLHLPALQALDMTDTYYGQGGAASALLPRMLSALAPVQLRDLSIDLHDACTVFRGMRDTRLFALTKLTVSGSARTGRGFRFLPLPAELAQCISGLEVLELRDNVAVTDSGIASLSALPALRRVDLWGCPLVTPAVHLRDDAQVCWL